MKYAVALLFIVALIGQAVLDNEYYRNKRMIIAEQSFATGCYIEAERGCPIIKETLVRGKCYEDAFVNCPKWAKDFRNWLENGKR
jgi:hypothetical protein